MDPDLAYEAAEGKAAAQPGRTSSLPSGAQITELKAERLKLTNRTIDVLQRVLARDLAAHRFAGRSYLRPALTRLSPRLGYKNWAKVLRRQSGPVGGGRNYHSPSFVVSSRP